MDINQIRLKDKKYCLVADLDIFDDEDEFLNAIASGLKVGFQMIQLKAKNSVAGRMVEVGKKIRNLCSMYGAVFVVNDRADVAKIVEADGVHLDQYGIAVHCAREILDSNAIVGLSVSSYEQVVKAQQDRVDYIVLESIFSVSVESKTNDFISEITNLTANNSGIPFYIMFENNSVDISSVIGSVIPRIALNLPMLKNRNIEDYLSDILNKLK